MTVSFRARASARMCRHREAALAARTKVPEMASTHRDSSWSVRSIDAFVLECHRDGEPSWGFAVMWEELMSAEPTDEIVAPGHIGAGERHDLRDAAVGGDLQDEPPRLRGQFRGGIGREVRRVGGGQSAAAG